MKSWLSPGTLLWMFCHIMIFMIGVMCIGGVFKPFGLTDALQEGIGGSLVATGVAGLALYVYVRATDSLRERLEVLAVAGLAKVFQFRSIRIRDEYDKRFEQAREIDLIGYGLSAFREDYADHFVRWSLTKKVRILLVNPEFPAPNLSYADQRDVEEGHVSGKTRRDVEAFVRLVSSKEGLNYDNFEIRLLNAIPSINMLRIDDEIFWGPYLVPLQSRNTPTLLVQRGGYLYENLREHFSQAWKNYAVECESTND